MVKLGVYAMGEGVCADPAAGARVAEHAETLGYESLWVGDHVVAPSPRVAPSKMEPDHALLDPLLALAHLAAHTTTILLGTGVVILPQRNPVVFAKQVASLDVICGGRLLLGVGAGYVPQEMEAVGVPFAERGARTDEYLVVLRELWRSGPPRHRGRFVTVSDVDAFPKPLHPAGPPVHVGGSSEAALRRAVRSAAGWYGYGLEPEDALRLIGALRTLEAAAERSHRLEITVTPRRALTESDVIAFDAMGVDRLVVDPRGQSEVELLAWLESTVRRVSGALA